MNKILNFLVFLSSLILIAHINYANAGTITTNSSGATVVSNTLPLCNTNQVSITQIPTSFTQTNSATFPMWDCYGGPTSLRGFIKSISFIGSDGSSINVYTNSVLSPTANDFVELVNNSLPLLNNVQTSKLFSSGNFILSKIELIMSPEFEVTAQGTINDLFVDSNNNVVGSRTCGTTTGSYTFSAPINNSNVTLNGRPNSFFQKTTSASSNNAVTPVWWQIDGFQSISTGATNITLGNYIYYASTNATPAITQGSYAVGYSVPISTSDSQYVSQVSINLLDQNGNPAGWSYVQGSNSGIVSTATSLVLDMTLRSPITFSSSTNFNLNLSLDLSRFLAFSMYMNVSNNSSVYQLGQQGQQPLACQNIGAGIILLNIGSIAVSGN